MSIISYYRDFVCSKFYSPVLSCTAHADPQPHKRAKRRACGVHRVRVRCGASAPHRARLGEMWEWIRYDSLFSSSLKKWIRTDSLRRPAYIFCTIFWIWFCHIHTPSFLICIVVSCNPLEYTFRGRKKSPENLTDLVRPSGLFLYFLCSIRA